MKNEKSPGNDRITREFYGFFWDKNENSLSHSIKKSFISGELKIHKNNTEIINNY